MSARERFSKFVFLYALCFVLLIGCISKPEPQKSVVDVEVLKVGPNNFANVTQDPEAVVLVLITDGTKSASVLEKYYFASTVDQEVPLTFAHFEAADSAEAAIYGITQMPTVALYAGGFLIDRVSGQPGSFDESTDLKRDFNLWMQSTVVEHALDRRNKVRYRFNDSTKLSISTY